MVLFNIVAKKTKKLRNFGTKKFKDLKKRFLTRKVTSLSPRTKLVTQIQRTYRKRLKSKETLKKKLKDAQKWAARENAEIERASTIIVHNKEQLKNRTAMDGSSVRMTRGHKQMLEEQISKSQTKINMHNSINYRALLLELEQQLAANIVRDREIATRTDAALLEQEDDNDSYSDSDTDSAHHGGARCANCAH